MFLCLCILLIDDCTFKLNCLKYHTRFCKCLRLQAKAFSNFFISSSKFQISSSQCSLLRQYLNCMSSSHAYRNFLLEIDDLLKYAYNQKSHNWWSTIFPRACQMLNQRAQSFLGHTWTFPLHKLMQSCPKDFLGFVQWSMEHAQKLPCQMLITKELTL